MKNKRATLLLLGILVLLILALIGPVLVNKPMVFNFVSDTEVVQDSLVLIDTTNIRIQTWVHYYSKHPYEIDRKKRNFYYSRVREMFMESGFSPDVASIYAELPSIESNWNSRAVSHAGARGLWQIMPSTAKEYGYSADELMDPEISTRIAIAHIKDLDSLHQHDIAKVFFSYNGGLGTVRAGLEKYETDNVWLVPFPSTETYHFAPKVLGVHFVLANKQ